MVLRATGDPRAVLAVDRTLAAHGGHWLVREIVNHIRRTLKRVDLTSRTFFALVEPGNAFAGTLFELVLAADRAYMLHDDGEANTVQLSPMNAGVFPMSNGISRLQVRFLGEPRPGGGGAGARRAVRRARGRSRPGSCSPRPTRSTGTTRCGWRSKSARAFSPDALTGMEANLRFAGPETMETKIFGRLTAWQNWIFQRPNAVGEKGALMTYGREGRPSFDWRRT